MCLLASSKQWEFFNPVSCFMTLSLVMSKGQVFCRMPLPRSLCAVLSQIDSAFWTWRNYSTEGTWSVTSRAPDTNGPHAWWCGSSLRGKGGVCFSTIKELFSPGPPAHPRLNGRETQLHLLEGGGIPKNLCSSLKTIPVTSTFFGERFLRSWKYPVSPSSFVC